jgi:ABC-type transporter Mla subunit MlaD
MARRKIKAEHIHWPVLVAATLCLVAVGGLVLWYERVGAERKAAPPGTTFQAAKEAGATLTPSEPPPKIEIPRPAPTPERH